MAKVPVGSAICRCGYSFEQDNPATAPSRTADTSDTVSAERQYESYLEARLQQSLDHLRTVREECSHDKWTSEQDQKVQQALQALQNARKELTAQRRKAIEVERESALRRTRRGLRTTVARSGVSASHTARSTRGAEPRPAAPVASAPTPAPRTGERHVTQPVAKKPAALPKPKTAPAVQAAATKPARPPAPAGQQPRRGMPAIGGFMAVDIDTSASPIIEHPEHAPLSAPSQTAITKLPASDTHVAPAGQAMAVIPTKNFRHKQATLAQRLIENNAAAPSTGHSKAPDMPSVDGFSPAPNDAFRTAQSAKAGHAGPGPDKTQECPHCTAKLPANAKRCRCGHDLAKEVSQFPEFEVPAEEYAIAGLLGNPSRRT